MKHLKLPAALLGLFLMGGVLQWIHPLAQPQGYHQFADTRIFCGVHNGADVLSNLVIFAAGLVNLSWCLKNRGARLLQMPGMLTAGLGLVITAAGSAYYHSAPTDVTLVWDRLPMTVVFAGILGMLFSSVTARRVAWSEMGLLVVASVATVFVWVKTGCLWPYALLQFGGLAAIVGSTVARKVDTVSGWWAVIKWYAVAKVFEELDGSVWMLTHHLFAGHALKHIACGLAGLALLAVVSGGKDENSRLGLKSFRPVDSI
jgi:hypothetical protein